MTLTRRHSTRFSSEVSVLQRNETVHLKMEQKLVPFRLGYNFQEFFHVLEPTKPAH